MNKHVNFEGLPIKIEMKRSTQAGPFYHRNAVELIFLMEGEAEVECGGLKNVLRSGDFSIVSAGTFHAVRSKRGCLVASIFFDLDFYAQKIPYIKGINIMFRPRPDNRYDHLFFHAVKNYLIRLLVIFRRDMPAQTRTASEIGDILITLLLNNLRGNYLKMPPDIKEQELERLLTITNFISSNYTNGEIKINDIARAANLSASRTAHFWREYSELPFRDVLAAARLNEAARMLVESDLSISEIAECSGFSDEKYLYGRFREAHGMTPTDFRHMHRAMDKEGHEYLDIRSQWEAIKRYGAAQYRCLEDFSFLPRRVRKREENLFRLYGHIVNGREVTDGECRERVRILLEPDRGLIERDGRFMVNWEYIFAAFLLCRELHDRVEVEFDAAFLPPVEWERLAEELRDALIKRFGARTDDLVRWRLRAVGVGDRTSCETLASRLVELHGRDDVETIFVF